jgi:hypothetical protein
MRALRCRRDLRYLALAALAVQLVGAFGHVHSPRAGHEAAALACRTFFPPASEQQCPASPRHEKCCALCLAMAVAGSLVPCQPADLALPLRQGDGLEPERDHARVASVATSAFDARGPPCCLLG